MCNMTLPKSKRNPSYAAGFSLIELLVAMLILLVGLLSMASLMLGGAAASLQAKDLDIANQLAKEAMEGVFTARIAGNLPFNSIRNKSQGGLFLDGYQPIKSPGRNGLVNTDADLTQPPLSYVDPGKDGIYGTADDKFITFDRFQRQVLITDIVGDPSLRRVTVNVQFTFKGITSVATVTTVLSPIN